MTDTELDLDSPASRTPLVLIAGVILFAALCWLATLPGVWHVWFPLQHWMAIHTGTVNESGPFYGFFSGFGSDLGEATLIGGIIAIYRKYNCHARWCLRFGRHDFLDPNTGVTYKLCRHCHPAHPGKRQLTRAQFHAIHHRSIRTRASSTPRAQS